MTETTQPEPGDDTNKLLRKILVVLLQILAK